MNLILVVLSIILIILAGLAVGEYFKFFNGKSIQEKIAFAYGFGVGMVAVIMFAMSVIGIKWNFYIFILTLSFTSLLFLFRSEKVKGISLTIKKLSLSQSILILLVLLVSIYVTVGSILRPLPSWDGWSSFYLHGKAFYLEGFINPEVPKYSGVSSPPLVPLLIAYIYFIVGDIEDKYSLILFSTFYLATGILLFENLKKRVTFTRSLFFTFLLLSVPNLIRHAGGVDVGHADIIVGYYFFAATISVLEYAKSYSYAKLILSQMFLALCSLVKDEGLPFFVTGQLLLIYLFLKRKRINHFYFLIVGISIIAGWWFFKLVNNLPLNPFIQHFPNFERLLPVIYSQLSEIFNIKRWNLIWPISLFIIVIAKKNFEIHILIFLVTVQIAFYFYIYLTTPIDPINHIAGSFDRLLLHILPTFIFLSGLSSAKIRK